MPLSPPDEASAPVSALLRADADVVRALVAAARAGEPFTVEGVTYVPEARLTALTDAVRTLCAIAGLDWPAVQRVMGR